MRDLKIELLEYVTEEGLNPFRKWLDNLRDIQARARIRIRLNRVRLGNFGDSKSVGDGVLELRVRHGPGYRVYFGRSANTVVILLCGGDKATQSKDVQMAKHFWADYQRRKS
jgi:putative addiction module killer protein